MRTRVRTPDGQIITVEHEAGASPEQIKELARDQATIRGAAAESAAAPFEGGRVPRGIQSERSRMTFKEYAPAAISTLAGFIPPIAPEAKIGAPLMTRAASKILPFAERVLVSEALFRGAEKALGAPQTPWYLGGGARQMLGEAPALPVKWAINAAGARRATARFGEQMLDYQEAVPARYMAQARAAVPAFKDLPETLAGLDRMAGSEGQRLLGQRFDPALKQAIADGRGKSLLIREDDAKLLDLTPLSMTLRLPGGQAGRMTAGRAGLLPDGMVYVDAGQAAEKITGRWDTNPGPYNRVVNGLYELGIGDRAAHAEYRLGQGARQLIRQMKAIKLTEEGQPVFDLDAYRKGLTVGGRPLQELERRKMPIEPFRQVLAGRPQPPEITRRRLPIVGHPFATGATAQAPFSAAGSHAAGLPFSAGVLASEMLPQSIVTQAPLTGAQQFATRVTPGLTGAAVKLAPEYLKWLGQPAAKPSP